MTGGLVVLDVGKTRSKLTLWSAAGEICRRRTRPNVAVAGPGYTALDVDGIAAWLAEALAEFAALGPVEAIVPVGHGAAAAVVRDGSLVCPPLDYEHPLPPAERRIYDRLRDDFTRTGSPALPDGLNLGAQLHHLETLIPGLLGPGATLLTWPQYWAWLLSGVAAAEVTSLGCHSDLWDPAAGCPSGMAVRRGWASRLPPLCGAGEALGPIRRDWAARTGLSPDTKIYCGLHDSNAALLAARAFPEIADKEATVLSTGTWFVAMRTPAPDAGPEPGALPEQRDCLINVDVAGRMVPSARFMGGREIETLAGIGGGRFDIPSDQPRLVAAIPGVLASGAMILPTFAPGFGPFPHARGRWIDRPADAARRRTAIGLYAALVADAALDLIGAKERILIEGRFAEAQVFVRALASLRPDAAIYTADIANDVSYGALRLVRRGLAPRARLSRAARLDADLAAYRRLWRARTEQKELVA